MIKLNKGTQRYNGAVWTWEHCNYGSIEEAYANPSEIKRQTYNNIWHRAMQTEGYNHDLKVTGRSSNFYSTMYSVTCDGVTTVIYDTYANIYAFDLD